MSIYDDVAALQLKVNELETAMQQTMTELTMNTDVFTLDFGDYLIPNTSVCATLLNKPTTSNSTGFIKVMPGGNSGQKIIYYVLCSKNSTTYYQVAFYQETWGNWKEINIDDSGWIDLTLETNLSAYSEAQKPRYRRIGKEIFLNGVVKGITTTNTLIATLPIGYRPAKHEIVACASVGQMISKISIGTDGTIIYNRSTIEPIIGENWHSIACSFTVD